ncbi:hypothetical protein B0H13DRAFT_2033907 [Mycena leptocephala]|nr:hypothetical protein B0H13DRAFT_2033907 [Mycena leptocephala]
MLITFRPRVFVPPPSPSPSSSSFLPPSPRAKRRSKCRPQRWVTRTSRDLDVSSFSQVGSRHSGSPDDGIWNADEGKGQDPLHKGDKSEQGSRTSAIRSVTWSSSFPQVGERRHVRSDESFSQVEEESFSQPDTAIADEGEVEGRGKATTSIHLRELEMHERYGRTKAFVERWAMRHKKVDSARRDVGSDRYGAREFERHDCTIRRP